MICPLILLQVSFEEQMFLILMKSSLSLFSYMDNVFGVMSKTFLHTPMSQRDTHSYLRIFMVLSFTVGL